MHTLCSLHSTESSSVACSMKQARRRVEVELRQQGEVVVEEARVQVPLVRPGALVAAHDGTPLLLVLGQRGGTVLTQRGE